MRSQGVDLGDRRVVKGTFSILIRHSRISERWIPSEISSALWAAEFMA